MRHILIDLNCLFGISIRFYDRFKNCLSFLIVFFLALLNEVLSLGKLLTLKGFKRRKK